jgi:hypothetical protein
VASKASICCGDRSTAGAIVNFAVGKIWCAESWAGANELKITAAPSNAVRNENLDFIVFPPEI